ncbi:MerR family transcriptional regulator [Cryobacterium lactosi]|uniref:MerR family transcriptional regulator n=1 Tax=Cryobacterium lactosi TaxID=1259202 RepID=A0A4R9BX48_9MICO|nr:MerR family transcriptional regulator [Cryobacterium lactosi]TFD92083.1 MerR family transcriptional regulator [Cryobacterium lactosi]
MAWSTSQLAELAGTTIKSVRHYHKVGLLDVPERKPNGYKQYGVADLLRLLQITRLAELGVPLAQISALGRSDEYADGVIIVLEAELEATIQRLQRARSELALILRHKAPPELPVQFSDVAVDLSPVDRAMIMVFSRISNESAMSELASMIRDEPRTESSAEFEGLAGDADRATRQRLGAALAPALRRAVEEYPRLMNLASMGSRGTVFTRNTLAAAAQDLYNSAQLEVLYRAHLIATEDAKLLADLEAALDAKAAAGGSVV